MRRRTSGGLFAAAILLAGGSGRLLARGDGTFGATNPTTDLRVGGGPALAAGDFNKDGKPDLANVDDFINGHVLLQDPSDRTVWKELALPQANGSFFLRAADLDGDGMEDLMGANPGTGVFFLRSRGDGIPRLKGPGPMASRTPWSPWTMTATGSWTWPPAATSLAWSS